MNAVVIEEVAFGSARYREVTALRRELLRKPLGLDFAPDELAREKDDRHLAAVSAGRVVGTLLLRGIDARTARIMRMAVACDMQQKGVGRLLVEHAEALMRGAGAELIMMHARATAVGFYRRCGYTVVGEPFPEQGIEHVRMEKRLSAPP